MLSRFMAGKRIQKRLKRLEKVVKQKIETVAKAVEIRGVDGPPPSFEEHHRMSCVFCGLEVVFGLDNEKPGVYHAGPSCLWFRYCDNANQFSLFTKLKIQSDHGMLERN